MNRSKHGWNGTTEERFWKKVRISECGCWEWIGKLYVSGYSSFFLSGQTYVLGHRWVYERYVGKIPPGLTIDHLCRSKSCVNPLHLEPVTSAVNSLRGNSPPSINKRKWYCINGHPLSGDNIYHGLARSVRRCKICNRRYAFWSSINTLLRNLPVVTETLTPTVS